MSAAAAPRLSHLSSKLQKLTTRGGIFSSYSSLSPGHATTIASRGITAANATPQQYCHFHTSVYPFNNNNNKNDTPISSNSGENQASPPVDDTSTLSKSQLKKLKKQQQKQKLKEEKLRKQREIDAAERRKQEELYASVRNYRVEPESKAARAEYQTVKVANVEEMLQKQESALHQENSANNTTTTNQKPSPPPARVKISGWIQHIRHQGKGKISFLELRDGSTNENLQCVIEDSLALRAFFELKVEQSVEIYGTLHKNNSPSNYYRELHVEYFKMVGNVTELFAINQDTKVDVSIRDRHLFIRESKRMASILKFRSLLMDSLRRYFRERNHWEVTPPTLVQTEVEGGSSLFELDYFGKPAYLTQSSQLYLESVLPVMGDVYCIAQSYRAEKSQTPRHLAEYTHVEVERSFINFDQLMESMEDMIRFVVRDVFENGEALLREVHPAAFEENHYMQQLLNMKRETPFKRMTYHECIQFCNDYNIYPDNDSKEPFKIGDDITDRPEREMIEKIGEPVFMTRFPAEMKSFYMERCEDDDSLTESVDLLLPGVGEAIGGSMRIWDLKKLEAAFQKANIDPEPYYWYVDQRKYGSVPHGGYGLGLERLLMWILGIPHIREATLYPRYNGRSCTP